MIKLSKEHPYKDACKLLKISPVANYKSYKLSDETRNFIKLETIAKAIKEDWKPDLSNEKTVRYFVWGVVYTNHRSKKFYAGLLGVRSDDGLGVAIAFVGTSLEFKEKSQAKMFGELCKPILCKYLFNRDDHERFKLNW